MMIVFTHHKTKQQGLGSIDSATNIKPIIKIILIEVKTTPNNRKST